MDEAKGKNWKVPSGFDLEAAELILCNYEKTKSTGLKSYEARVYLWEKN